MNPLIGRQLNTLYQRSHLGLLVQLGLALSVAVILINKIPRMSLAAWSVGMVAILGLQLIAARFFLSKSAVSRPNLWQIVIAIINLIGGLLWGLLALIQTDAATLVQVALVVATAAAAAIVLWSSASSAIVFPAFMLGLLSPWGVALAQGALKISPVSLTFAGISVVNLGLFLLINRQAMELVRLQNHATRVARPLTSIATLSAKPIPVSAVHEDATMSTVTLAERNSRPYSGLKRRASDYRTAVASSEEPTKASSFGQIKINDIASTEPLEPAACTILVVEDNLDNQLVALHLLQKRGYRVVIANNGREALSAVERQRFELILMDVQMPEMGGLEATAAIRLKERQGAKRIPIIALTANPVSESREICLAAGMDDYLNKPISRTRLFAAMDAQLKKKPRQIP
jgi:CheY-like chemotaxis protein